jgi:cyclase
MADPGVRSLHFRIEPIADGVFAAIATDSGHGLCNSAIVDLGDGALVFDSMLTPQAGADLRRVAEKLTGHPVTYLVNSHYHGDHVRGNTSFPSVRIVSTRKVRDLIAERAVRAIEADRASMPEALADLRAGRLPASTRDRAVFEGWFTGALETPAGTVVPEPDLFVDDQLSLRGPRREVRVLTYGGGHSPSDVLAFLPEERVAFLGDLLFVGFHPSVGDGFVEPWIRILDSVKGLGARRFLPGHGPVGGAAEVERIQGYLRHLLERARSAHRSGLGREAVNSSAVPPEYAEWTFGLFYPENLLRAYDQTE